MRGFRFHIIMKKSYGIPFASLNLPVENHRRVQITQQQLSLFDTATIPQYASLSLGDIPPFGNITIWVESSIFHVGFYGLARGKHGSAEETVRTWLFIEMMAAYKKSFWHPRFIKQHGLCQFSVRRVRSGALMLKKIQAFLEQLLLTRATLLTTFRTEVAALAEGD